MSDFFYQIVTDAVNYYDTDTQAELYALSLDDAKDYMENILSDYISNEFLRKAVLADLCRDDAVYEWWSYIQKTCSPDPDEEEEEEEAEATGSLPADSMSEAPTAGTAACS